MEGCSVDLILMDEKRVPSMGSIMIRPLPPQAYTREMLVEAYDWLQHQPPSIRELARSADDMVSLFKQQQRQRGRAKSRVSPEEFQSDLKNLAQGLKAFDDEEESPQVAQVGPLESPSPPTPPREILGENLGSDVVEDDLSFHETLATPAQGAGSHHDQILAAPVQGAGGHYDQILAAPAQGGHAQVLVIDERTRTCIHMTCERLNLSHPNEALRFLVALGFEKIK